MARNPEVQISIDHLTVTRENGTVEARDVIITASGPDSYSVAAAVHTQLVTLLDIPDSDADTTQAP